MEYLIKSKNPRLHYLSSDGQNLDLDYDFEYRRIPKGFLNVAGGNPLVFDCKYEKELRCIFKEEHIEDLDLKFLDRKLSVVTIQFPELNQDPQFDNPDKFESLKHSRDAKLPYFRYRGTGITVVGETVAQKLVSLNIGNLLLREIESSEIV